MKNKLQIEIYPEYFWYYKQLGHPYGKSMRGFKKWFKKEAVVVLKGILIDACNKQKKRLL